MFLRCVFLGPCAFFWLWSCYIFGPRGSFVLFIFLSCLLEFFTNKISHLMRLALNALTAYIRGFAFCTLLSTSLASMLQFSRAQVLHVCRQQHVVPTAVSAIAAHFMPGLSICWEVSIRRQFAVVAPGSVGAGQCRRRAAGSKHCRHLVVSAIGSN